MLEALERGEIAMEILYGDYAGGQRVISRFGVFHEDGVWRHSVVRHWRIDHLGPR